MKRTGLVGIALAAAVTAVALQAADGSPEWQPAPPVQPAAPAPPPPPEVIAGRMAMASGGSYLGVNVAEVSAERARELKLPEERGVEITMLEADGPAAKGGLQKGDVVLEYNGQRVEGTEQFVRLVRETPPGRQVKLLVHRAGSAMTISLATGTRKKRTTGGGLTIPRVELPEIRIPDVPRAFMSWRSAALGIEAESLEAQLAEYFGVKEGVLVRSVMAGSAASKAGLKAGDVIVKVDGKAVATPREISSALRSAGSRSVSLGVVRNRQEISMNVTLDEAERSRAAPRGHEVRVIREE